MQAKYYAVPGQSAFTAYLTSAGFSPAPGEILMNGPRPTPEHMAQPDGTWAQSVPTLDEVIQKYDDLIDTRLESFAREYYSKGYANAVTYKDSSVPAWKLEAEYLIRLRDETWMAAYAFLNEALPLVMAGERAVPVWGEILAHLPVPTWPEGSRGYVAE